jgi:hypothetical protein
MACLVICWLITGCGQRDESTPCSICGVANWTRFSPAGERFSVFMPLKPTTSTVMADTPLGKYPVHYFSAVPLKGHLFGVTYNSFPPEVDMSNSEKLFEKIEKGYLTSGFQNISKTNITLNGTPGRELIYEKEGQVMTLRLYFIDQEAYQVLCIMPQESVCQKHIHEFLESFQFKQK